MYSELFLPTPKKKEPKAVYGIMGKAGAGKDTASDMFVDIVGDAYKYNFADPLKEMCSYVFDIPKVWMYDQELKKQLVRINMGNEGIKERMREWVRKEILNNPKWAWHIARPDLSGYSVVSNNRVEDVAKTLIDAIIDVFVKLQIEGKIEGKNHIEDIFVPTPREWVISIRLLLQYMGTEVIRNSIDDKFWAEIKTPDKTYGKTVYIADCRFSTEVDFILSHPKGEIIVVQNPDLEKSDVGNHSSEEFVDEIESYMAQHYPLKTINYIHNGFQRDSMTKLREQIKTILTFKGLI
jgi:hypothetical protein